MIGGLGGAVAGAFAGMGNAGAATTAWQLTGFGFDAIMNAYNVMDALNSEQNLEKMEDIQDADICFTR